MMMMLRSTKKNRMFLFSNFQFFSQPQHRVILIRVKFKFCYHFENFGNSTNTLFKLAHMIYEENVSFNFGIQTEEEKTLQTRIVNLNGILSGDTTIKLHLEFLIRNNHADLLILKNTKVSKEFLNFLGQLWKQIPCSGFSSQHIPDYAILFLWKLILSHFLR